MALICDGGVGVGAGLKAHALWWRSLGIISAERKAIPRGLKPRLLHARNTQTKAWPYPRSKSNGKSKCHDKGSGGNSSRKGNCQGALACF